MKHIRSSNIKDLTDVYLESLLQDLPSEDKIADKQVLSERFLNRMNRLVRSTYQPTNAWKKILLIAVIICTILFTALSVFAYREAITGFIINIYKEFSSVAFSNQSDTFYSGADNDLTENLPVIIPQGYKISELMEQASSVIIIYSNEEGMNLLFTKTRKSSLQINIDTGVESR